jgi:hypothetical protein
VTCYNLSVATRLAADPLDVHTVAGDLFRISFLNCTTKTVRDLRAYAFYNIGSSRPNHPVLS